MEGDTNYERIESWVEKYSKVDKLCDGLVKVSKETGLRCQLLEEENLRFKRELETVKIELSKENESLKKEVKDLKQIQGELKKQIAEMLKGYENIYEKHATKLPDSVFEEISDSASAKDNYKKISDDCLQSTNSMLPEVQNTHLKQDSPNENLITLGSNLCKMLDQVGGISPFLSSISTVLFEDRSTSEKQASFVKSSKDTNESAIPSAKKANSIIVQSKDNVVHESRKKGNISTSHLDGNRGIAKRKPSTGGLPAIDGFTEDVSRLDKYKSIAAKRKLASDISHSESKKVKPLEPDFSPKYNLVIDENNDNCITVPEPSMSIFTQRKLAGSEIRTGTCKDQQPSKQRDIKKERSPEFEKESDVTHQSQHRHPSKKGSRSNRHCLEDGEIEDSPKSDVLKFKNR